MANCKACGEAAEIVRKHGCAKCIFNGYRHAPCYACDKDRNCYYGGRGWCDEHYRAIKAGARIPAAYAPSIACYRKIWEYAKTVTTQPESLWYWSGLAESETRQWDCGSCGRVGEWSLSSTCQYCGAGALWCDDHKGLVYDRNVVAEAEEVSRTLGAADGTPFYPTKQNKLSCEECMKKAGKHLCAKCRRVAPHKIQVAHADLDSAQIHILAKKFGRNYFTDNHGYFELEERYVCGACLESPAFPLCKCTEVTKEPHYGALGTYYTSKSKKASGCVFCLMQMPNIYRCAYCHAVWRGEMDKSGYCPTCVEIMQPCGACGMIADLKGREFCRRCMQVGAHNARAEEVYAFEAPACHAKCTGTTKHAENCTFDGIYLGVELEVECGREDRGIMAANVRKQLQNKFLVKHDGSLANGLEIVSPPAYMGWHMENWKSLFDWNDKTKHLRSHDTGTCGMHVHLSRKPLNKQHIKNCVTFLHDPKNHDFVAMVAGRPSGHYHDFSAPKGKWNDTYSVETDNINRYTALNLTNAHTIEYRMFRGSMKWETFAARLEFARALTLFAKRPEDELTKEEFLAWVETQHDFPNLQRYLAKGLLIKERK